MGWHSSVGIVTRYGLTGRGDRIPVEARFSAPVQTDPGAHQISYTMGTGSFLGVKRPGRGVDHPPHLAPRLKKEYSYISTPPLGLRGLFEGELYAYLLHAPGETTNKCTYKQFSTAQRHIHDPLREVYVANKCASLTMNCCRRIRTKTKLMHVFNAIFCTTKPHALLTLGLRASSWSESRCGCYTASGSTLGPITLFSFFEVGDLPEVFGHQFVYVT